MIRCPLVLPGGEGLPAWEMLGIYSVIIQLEEDGLAHLSAWPKQARNSYGPFRLAVNRPARAKGMLKAPSGMSPKDEPE